MRPKHQSDPDPDLATVLLFIWPLMLLVTLAELVLLVFIAGLTGQLMFPALLLCLPFNYAAIKAFCKEVTGGSDVEGQTGDAPVNEQGSEQNDEQGEKKTEEAEQSFHAIAAVSSTWLPCVVGQQSQRIFLVSGIASLASKVFLLVLALTLAASGLQPDVYKRPFLLFCFQEDSLLLKETNTTKCKYSEGNCFPNMNLTHETKYSDALSVIKRSLQDFERTIISIDDDMPQNEKQDLHEVFQNELNTTSKYLTHIKDTEASLKKILYSAGIGRVQQKIRICEDDETPFRLCILSGLVAIIVLAAYAIYRLHKIADYQVLPSYIFFH